MDFKTVWSLGAMAALNQDGQGPVPPKGSIFGGGYYITDITYADGRKFGLIFSPLIGGQSFSSWKTSDTNTPNTNSSFDGFSNSEAMIVAGPAQHPAGNYCRTLSLGGYTDWYLPSYNELLSIHNVRFNLPQPEFQFNLSMYWASTSASSISGMYVDFQTGGSGGLEKHQMCYVRAIRRFLLN